MKKINAALMCMMIALIAFAMPTMAQETVEVIPEADVSKLDLYLPIILAVIIPIASLLANLTVVKDDDKTWVKALKKILNTFALNFSSNAGK